MYATLEYYQSTYFGNKVPLADFSRLAVKADALVNHYTFNRITEPTDGVKMAACEIVDMLYKLEQTDGRVITSESIGTSHSMTYDVNDKDPAARKAKAILFQWLSHTGLLYRGV